MGWVRLHEGMSRARPLWGFHARGRCQPQASGVHADNQHYPQSTPIHSDHHEVERSEGVMIVVVPRFNAFDRERGNVANCVIWLPDDCKVLTRPHSPVRGQRRWPTRCKSNNGELTVRVRVSA
jgi:hypothetical protein